MPTSNADHDDATLWLRIRRGEEEAFTMLYRQHAPHLHRFAQRLTGSAAIADDVVQDVFLAVVQASAGSGGYDPAVGSLRSYLYGAARNASWKRLRAPAPAGDALGGSGQRTDEDAAAVRDALAALDPDFRAVVILCDVEGLSYEESAAALGVPVGTVRSRLSRARARLAALLDDAPTPQPAGGRRGHEVRS